MQLKILSPIPDAGIVVACHADLRANVMCLFLTAAAVAEAGGINVRIPRIWMVAEEMQGSFDSVTDSQANRFTALRMTGRRAAGVLASA